MQSINITSPPWRLRGAGTIILYRFDRDFVADNGFVPPDLLPHYDGGLGAIVLVDYKTSPVGAYQELLFIPGRFRQGRKRFHSVTKAYVSSELSAVNGRANWGIPKELARFNLEPINARTMRFSVAGLNAGPVFFQAEVQAGILRTPFNTLLNPFSLRLVQQSELGRWLVTTPRAGGVISLTASLSGLAVDSSRFPDVSGYAPLGVFDLPQLRLSFPPPERLD